MYRSKKYQAFIKSRPAALPGAGPYHFHHVKLLGGGGMRLKPPDTHGLKLPHELHHRLDSPGHSERSVFAEFNLSPDDVAAMIEANISDYLESLNIDSVKLKIELMTRYLEENNY